MPKLNLFGHRCKDRAELCDFQIRCGPQHSWKVHKWIVCPQSDFLDRAAFGSFMVSPLPSYDPKLILSQEGVSGEVDLSNYATPDTIARVVHYFYHQDYDDIYAERAPNDVWNLESIEPPSWPQPLTVNAEMFVMAEQLGIHALKDLATKKTEQVMAKTMRWRDFGRAVQTVYESTPPMERRIRQLYVELFRRCRSSLFKRSDCEDLMVDIEATGRFMTDVARIDASVLDSLDFFNK